MTYSIGDRINNIQTDIGANEMAAMSLIFTRAAIDQMKDNNDLKPYLLLFWTEWREWYNENKLPGTPALPQLIPPVP